jgi:hypothetical protein
MELLKRLCCAQLPVNIDDDDDIEKCSVLRAAQLIEAEIPPILHEDLGQAMYSGHATVMRVTTRGRAASGICTTRAGEFGKFPSPPVTGERHAFLQRTKSEPGQRNRSA